MLSVLTVLSVSVLLVVACVGIHYSALVNLSRLRRGDSLRRRRRLNLLVLGALLAHVVEVSCFSLGYAALDNVGNFGELHKNDAALPSVVSGALGNVSGYVELHGSKDTEDQESNDYWYFSFVAYTSLGFGDITPRGSLRFMTALETLTGLVLIAWTASFIFLEMQATWNPDQNVEPGRRPADRSEPS